MKLTVALRIIGGFGVISVLLLIIGLTSYSSLNNISDSTSQVNTISIPALENSATLKSEFVIMSKITLQAFYTDEVKKITAFETAFAAEKDAYDAAAKNLQSVVGNEPVLAASFKDVTGQYDEFIPTSNNLFAQLKKSLSLRDSINSKLGDLESNADDSASLILDFSDVRDVSRRFPKAAEAASVLETSMNSMVSTVVDLTRTNAANTSETLSNEIKNRMTDIVAKMAIIKAEAGGAVDMVADLDEKITTINELLTAEDGILALKSNKLAAEASAAKLLATAEQQTTDASAALSKLLTKAREAAGEIQEESESSVSSAIVLIFGVMAFSFVAAAAIALWTRNSITTPLGKVNAILGVVASGDLTKQLDDSAQDEFGELARNCNQVIGNLRQLIQGIISRSTQLAAASEQTSAITVQSTAAIREQKSQVTQAATATTEMSSTSQGVLQSSNDALAEIKHADAEAERVKGISSNNKQTILQLSQEVEQASKVINKLHQDSASIGSILDVIRGIAEQTNLLALNAAIEAARAGEQGRGFAVVADEVRSLASKTQSSTQEIQAMIQVLQSGAHAAVEAMNKGRRQAENCVAQTEVADQALDSITHAVHMAHDMSEQISHAAKEQNQVSHEISKLLESIVNIAEETASGAEQTSDSSHEVARLAEELRLSVDQFKV
ncbi:methyl-accepting chemotaxis protein [Rheinheimera sp. F8]|uniref:methyl-accepting chemotaxis protein n=1 Tax=Rheinheimera sp. F8 TaxID=1763998 RepID=UPI000744ABCA|nr:methyl-accepting chemotaxis protein [Rheinheimera sp. F8]ALZ75461.1 chemotaxis protein [Rheinheimera sp. F8]ALZ77509.1 chemotaxis protein [Rheinheimera sp. F8]